MSKRRTAAVLLAMPLLMGVLTGCPPQKGSDSMPLISTINEDDGEHRLRTYGRFKFDKSLSPHRAGIACTWKVEAKSDSDKQRRLIDHGTETDGTYIPKPQDETTKVWLTSTSCGRWD